MSSPLISAVTCKSEIRHIATKIPWSMDLVFSAGRFDGFQIKWILLDLFTLLCFNVAFDDVPSDSVQGAEVIKHPGQAERAQTNSLVFYHSNFTAHLLARMADLLCHTNKLFPSMYYCQFQVFVAR